MMYQKCLFLKIPRKNFLAQLCTLCGCMNYVLNRTVCIQPLKKRVKQLAVFWGDMLVCTC